MEEDRADLAIKRLWKGFRLMYLFVKYGIPYILTPFFIVFIIIDSMPIQFKIFFIVLTLVFAHFIKRILQSMDENLLKTY